MNAVFDNGAAAGAAADDAAPGERLARARQTQGLSTADVARRLKLSVWQIEALEAGNYGALPGPIFVRGFIRNYARLLDLEPEELLQAAAGSLPHVAPSPETPRSRDIPYPAGKPRAWRKFGATAAVIVGLLAVYEFYWDEPATAPTQPEGVAAQAPAIEPAPPRPARSAEASRPEQAAVASAAAREAPARTVRDAPPVASRPPHPDEREVRFIFEQESWIEVYDRDEKQIFYQLNPAGTSRRVIGVPPLRVVVGNAHGVKMTYGGQPVDLARYTKIDVARLTLE